MTYLRYPQLVGDTVVFVADDDVWLVPASGGTARRLTSDRAPVARPRLSADGTAVAWTSRRDGNPEVYWVPSPAARRSGSPGGTRPRPGCWAGRPTGASWPRRPAASRSPRGCGRGRLRSTASRES